MDDEKPLQDACPARSIEAYLLARMATNGGLSDNTRLKKSGITRPLKSNSDRPAGGGEKHRQFVGPLPLRITPRANRKPHVYHGAFVRKTAWLREAVFYMVFT